MTVPDSLSTTELGIISFSFTRTASPNGNETKSDNSVIIIIGSVIAFFLAILTAIQIHGKCKTKLKTQRIQHSVSETYAEINEAVMLPSVERNENRYSRKQSAKYDVLKEKTKNEYLFIQCETENEIHKVPGSNTSDTVSGSLDQSNKSSDYSQSPEKDDKDSYLEPVNKPTHHHHYIDIMDNPYLDVVHTVPGSDVCHVKVCQTSSQYDDVLPNRPPQVLQCDEHTDTYLNVVNNQ